MENSVHSGLSAMKIHFSDSASKWQWKWNDALKSYRGTARRSSFLDRKGEKRKDILKKNQSKVNGRSQENYGNISFLWKPQQPHVDESWTMCTANLYIIFLTNLFKPTSFKRIIKSNFLWKALSLLNSFVEINHKIFVHVRFHNHKTNFRT